jgi:hypothetical protein
MPVATARGLLICCLIVLFPPRPVLAEWHFTPTLGATFLGKASPGLIDPDLAIGNVHRNFGGDVTLLGGGIFGAESVVVGTPGFLTGNRGLIRKSRSIAVMGNAVLTTPRRWTEYSLRPFVSGGFGLLRVSKTEVADVFSTNRNVPAFNIGGGAVGFLSKRTGVRFDFRYYRSLNGDAGSVALDSFYLRHMTASIGLVLRR